MHRKQMTVFKALSGLAIGNFTDLDSGILISEHIQRSILEIMAHFNVPPMTDSQVVGCLDLLCEKHPDWSIEDFTVWSKTVRIGNVNGLEYPKSFHRIDPDMIIQFAGIYNAAKIEAREKKAMDEKSEMQRRVSEVPETDESILKQFVNQAKINAEKDKGKKDSGRINELREHLGTDKFENITEE